MSELKGKSSESVKTIDEQRAARADRNGSDVQIRTAAGFIAGTYDALDYRLMATFPASDAVAQY